MNKWEYIYAEAYHDTMETINGEQVGKFPLFGGIRGLNVKDFLKRVGEEGWEAVGICPASEGASRWRMLLKRPF